MKDIIWLSPSLAAGAIAARLVVFFGRRPQTGQTDHTHEEAEQNFDASAPI
jgi:hypothetical protein